MNPNSTPHRTSRLKQVACLAITGSFLFSALAPSYVEARMISQSKNISAHALRTRLQTMEESSLKQKADFQNKINAFMPPGRQNYGLPISLEPLFQKHRTTLNFFTHISDRIKKTQSRLKVWSSKNLWWEDAALFGSGTLAAVTSAHTLLFFSIGMFFLIHIPNIERDWKKAKLEATKSHSRPLGSEALFFRRPVPNKFIWVTGYILSIIGAATFLQLAYLAPIIAWKETTSPLLLSMSGLVALAVLLFHRPYSRWFRDHPTLQMGRIALGAAPLQVFRGGGEKHFTFGKRDFPSWTKQQNDNFIPILTYIYEFSESEFYHDPEILHAMARRMELDPNQDWRFDIRLVGEPSSGYHRSTVKIEVTATSLSSGVEIPANFALKISTPYHRIPPYIGLFESEVSLSETFFKEALFHKYFSNTLVFKAFPFVEGGTALENEIYELGPSMQEYFKDRDIPIGFDYGDFVYFQLDRWIEGMTFIHVYEQMKELKFPQERINAITKELATQVIVGALRGWQNLRMGDRGLIYELGLDDIMVSGFNGSENPTKDSVGVVFVDPNGGEEVGNELVLAASLDHFFFDLEHECGLIISPIEFFTIVLTVLGEDQGRELLQTFAHSNFPPISSRVFRNPKALSTNIEKFLRDLPSPDKGEGDTSANLGSILDPFIKRIWKEGTKAYYHYTTKAAAMWEEGLFRALPFSLLGKSGFTDSSLGSTGFALGWSTVGFASAHILALWVDRALETDWGKGYFPWKYAEYRDFSIFAKQIFRGMVLTALYLVSFNFLPIPSSVWSHLVSTVIVVVVHGAYNTAVLKGLVPERLNFSGLSPLPNEEKKIEDEIDLVVQQTLSSLAYASYKTNRAALQKKYKNQQSPIFLIDLEEQVMESEGGFTLPKYVQDWVEGLIHAILLHPYEDNQSIPTMGIVLQSKHRKKISQLLIEKWNIPEGTVLFVAEDPEDADKKAKEKNVTIVSVFTKRPQVWGNIAKWIITFMQGQELKIQGQELKMLKELFKGKLERVGNELVIPKKSLGLEGTENYFQQTIHFKLQA